MQAFVLEKYGGPDCAHFREMPRLRPAAGDLLVKVQSAGLNPVDHKFREGKLRPIYRPKLPVAMGNELAGTVVDCGFAVNNFAVGDHVFVRGHKAELGAFAEYACVPAPLVAKVPAQLDLQLAGGVPLAALTALQVLRDELQVKPGQTILITGGTGGVGTFAIQLAKRMGAYVTTTSSPAGIELAKSLGADEVLDYTKQPLHQIGRVFDCGFDLVGGDVLEQMFCIVKSGGKIVSIAGVPEPQTAKKDLGDGMALTFLFWIASYRLRRLARLHGVRYRYYFMHGSGSDLEQIANLIASGELKLVVDRLFPFGEIKSAFKYLEQGHAKGKVIVTM